jgi:hypothetical protein
MQLFENSPNLEGLATEGLGLFYVHLFYFTVIWYILWIFGIFCGNFVYFMAIWYILWPFVYFVAIWYILWLFGIFFPVSECCTKENLENLASRSKMFVTWREPSLRQA